MTEWLKDDNGNRCSIQYWGTREAAQKALDSLENCENCTNCLRCSDCSGCSECSRCSDCSRCSGCSDCSRCSRCSDCENIAFRENKKDLRADPSWTVGEPRALGVPPTPKIENIHQKIFEAISKPNALDMSTWHSCNTTHCRAGWAVHLAGEAGYALERFHGSLLAGQLIYRESGHPINPCRFFDGNEEAFADMKRLAEQST